MHAMRAWDFKLRILDRVSDGGIRIIFRSAIEPDLCLPKLSSISLVVSVGSMRVYTPSITFAPILKESQCIDTMRAISQEKTIHLSRTIILTICVATLAVPSHRTSHEICCSILSSIHLA